MTRDRVVRLVGALLLAFGVVHTTRFVLGTGDRLAFADRMTIDAESYARNARAMIDAGDLLFTPDRYHSLGMTLYTSLFLRLPAHGVLALKLANVAAWAIAAMLVFVVGRRAFRTEVAALAAMAIVVQSVLARRYCGIVQYEVVTMLLVAGMLALVGPAARDRRAALALGVVGGLATIVRVHFVLVPLLVALEFGRIARASSSEEDASCASGAARSIVAGTASVVAFVSIVISVRSQELAFVQSARSGSAWLTRLHASASGAMWPYPPRAEPHGIAFIVSDPGGYLRFLGRKALFLVGYERDVWHLSSEVAWSFARTTGIDLRSADRIVAVVLTSVVVVGLVRVVRRFGDEPLELRAAGCAVLALLAPQLVVGSSTRLLLPFLPALALLVVRSVAVPRTCEDVAIRA